MSENDDSPALTILNKIKSCLTSKKRVFLSFAKKRAEDSAREILYEETYGIETSSPYNYKDNISLYRDGYDYQPTPYHELEKMVDYLKLNSDDVCVDLGCGKGRVVFFLAAQRLKKVIGIEIVEELIKIARKNLDKSAIRNGTPIEIIHADAAKFISEDGTVFFMFNPFGHKTLASVIDNIKETLARNPRKIRIVYHNPVERKLLDREGWLTLEGQIEKTNIFVWHNRLE